jgi:hypothetical protein
MVALHRLWRWVVGPSGKHRRAAIALREQARFVRPLMHHQEAMELYDLTVRLNPVRGRSTSCAVA